MEGGRKGSVENGVFCRKGLKAPSMKEKTGPDIRKEISCPAPGKNSCAFPGGQEKKGEPSDCQKGERKSMVVKGRPRGSCQSDEEARAPCRERGGERKTRKKKEEFPSRGKQKKIGWPSANQKKNSPRLLFSIKESYQPNVLSMKNRKKKEKEMPRRKKRKIGKKTPKENWPPNERRRVTCWEI